MNNPSDEFTASFRRATPEPKPKTTMPGWPDPTDWVNQLYKNMSDWRNLYEASHKPLEKRHFAASMLAHVISNLLELPAFRNDSVHLPLKDLLIFLSDLDRGRDHPWSAPVNFGGTNITTTAQSELKVWVRAAFSILKSNGFKHVEAYRRIASGLTASGRSSRNGEPIRWQLVQAWCRETESQRDSKIRQKLERWWFEFRAMDAGITIIDATGKPIPEKEIAGKFADLCWSLEHLRDRSISRVSE